MNTDMGYSVSETLNKLRAAAFIVEPKKQNEFDQQFMQDMKKFTQKDMIKLLGGVIYMGEVTKGDFELNGMQSIGMYKKVKEIIQKNMGGLSQDILSEAENLKESAKLFAQYINETPGHLGETFNQWLNQTNTLSVSEKDILTEIFKTNLYENGSGRELFIENTEKLEPGKVVHNIFKRLNASHSNQQIMSNEEQHDIRDLFEKFNHEDRRILISGLVYMYDKVNIQLNSKSEEQKLKNKNIENTIETIFHDALSDIGAKVSLFNREGNPIIDMTDKIIDNKLHGKLNVAIDKNENLSYAEKSILSFVAQETIEETKKEMSIIPDRNFLLAKLSRHENKEKVVPNLSERETLKTR